MDIKLELAEQVCEELGYRLYPGRCDDCGFPLLEKNLGNTWFIGCWFCHDRKERAVSARATLHKARLAQVGIFIDDHLERQPLDYKQNDGLTGRNMFGMAL